MKIIEPRLSEDDARRFFERPRASNLWGLLFLLKRFSTPACTGSSQRRLPYLEILWLPHYWISFRVESPRGPGEISVSVETHSGAFAIFQMQDDLVEEKLDGEIFPPKLSETKALEIGRNELIASILRRRGSREKPSVGDPLEIHLFYYPFWVYYFQRRPGVIDFLVCDAARGGKGGARTKVGILSCLTG